MLRLLSDENFNADVSFRLPLLDKELNGLLRVRAELRQLFIGHQSERSHPRQLDEPVGPLQVIECGCQFLIAVVDCFVDCQKPLVARLLRVGSKIAEFGKDPFAEPFQCQRLEFTKQLPIRFFEVVGHWYFRLQPVATLHRKTARTCGQGDYSDSTAARNSLNSRARSFGW